MMEWGMVNWSMVFCTVFFCAAWAIETQNAHGLRAELATARKERDDARQEVKDTGLTYRTLDISKSREWVEMHAGDIVEEVGPPAFLLEQEQGQTQGGRETGLSVVWPEDEDQPGNPYLLSAQTGEAVK